MRAGAIVGAFLTFAPAYFTGRHDANQASATVALENSVRVLRKRNQINDEVSASDAAAICGCYGLSVDVEAECVRRVREAAAELQTTVTILKTDRLFADQVSTHNCFGASQGCW